MPGFIKAAACLCCLYISMAAVAQRGMPPAKKTSSLHVTHYAQHLDFSPEMVKLLKVPDGWQVKIAAQGLGKPRMLYMAPGGGVYVTRRDGGDVLLLKDANNDQVFEELVTVVAGFKGVHGITAKDGWLYVCNNNQLRRYRMNNDGTLGTMELLITDMPNGGQHSNRTMDFGPDGMLYLSIGSTCNDCKEGDKEMATMVQINPANWTRSVYASGLRNTIGFDWHPQTGELWGFDNGGDAKGDNWPPEELNRIVKNAAYGFPLAYGKQEVDESREDPPGDTKQNWVKGTQPSVLELPAHSAPIAFQFFDSSARLPAGYTGDGLVCWHGSWNREEPTGFKVQRVHFENGTAVRTTDFLSGFLQGNARFGRPAGLTIAPTGTVYVSDDANGIIYAVTRTM